MSITLLTADITRLRVEAIVNAANHRLLGGAGVDGAIHRAAGPRLLEACRALPELAPGVRCPTGEARITPGFDLPADHVIHVVGPVWRGGGHDEPALLAACYRNALQLAREHAIGSIAFPAISCGAYGYPPELAAGVARGCLRKLLVDLAGPPMDVHLCFLDPAMTALWQRVFNAA